MYFDDLKIGMEVATAPAVIEKEKMLAFARDYDNIPLHTDEEYAKTTPFGKALEGMLNRYSKAKTHKTTNKGHFAIFAKCSYFDMV